MLICKSRQPRRQPPIVSYALLCSPRLFLAFVFLCIFWLETTHAFLGLSQSSMVGSHLLEDFMIRADNHHGGRRALLEEANYRHDQSFSFTSIWSTLWMGKGDGKKKRKKKSGSGEGGGGGGVTPLAGDPAPMRVTSDSNVPVRHQLVWAKMNKEYRKQQSNPGFRQKKRVRTAYRRTWDEEEMEEKAEERRRRGQDPDWDVILSRSSVRPLVIVDGYNIIHKWARLKKHMNKGDPAHARQLLVDDLENLASLKGWRIECVFDGTRRSTVGPLGVAPGDNKVSRIDQNSKASVSKHGVRVVFSGIGMEADTYIESRCIEAKNLTEGQQTSSFIVATDDLMIRLAGQNAGAWIMSADRFVTELKSVKNAVSYRVEAAMSKVNGHAIRPEKLRSAPIRFGRNSVLIEDKRNRTSPRQRQQQELAQLQDQELEIHVEESENGVPWWAQLPKDANSYRD